jgi:hypothetical protein
MIGVLDRPALYYTVNCDVAVYHPRPKSLPAVFAEIVDLLIILDVLMSGNFVVFAASAAFDL